MKTTIILGLFAILLCTQVLAQTGGDLHVKGKIRSDSLANQNYLLIYADSTGTLDTLPPGAQGQVLISNGLGSMPYWGNNPTGSSIENYGVYATKTLVSSTHPTFTQISGLTQTITLTDSATVKIFTYGSVEGIGNTQGRSSCFVQVFNNGIEIPTASLLVITINCFIPSGAIQSWCLSTLLNLSAGTYTFDVRACKYGTSDNFYAGGNDSSPVQNQGALLLQVFY